MEDLKDRIHHWKFKATERKSLGWTDMALDRDQCWVVVNTRVILRVAWKAEYFFKS